MDDEAGDYAHERHYTVEQAEAEALAALGIEEKGAVVVTASHNPAMFCGIKYKPEYAGSASPEVVARLEEEIARVIESDEVVQMDLDEARAAGMIEMIDPRPSYRRQLAKRERPVACPGQVVSAGV